MEFIGYGLSIVLFALIFSQGLKRTWSDWVSDGVIDGAYPWPTWVSSALVPIGVGLLMFRLMQRLMHAGFAAFAPNSKIAKIEIEHRSLSEKQDDLP
jgi:TRAP-type C4-dicarboxylate transport system permease small subunit